VPSNPAAGGFLQTEQHFPSRRARKREQGSVVAELAVVLPLLMMLLMGIFWTERALMIHETITRAAREGARVATAPSCTLCGNTFYGQSYIQNSVIAPMLWVAHLDPAQVQNFTFTQGVVLNPGNTPTELGTVVSFTYPMQFPLPFASVNRTLINIRTQVQMREEH
jgi:TadE-like protein